MPPRMQHAESSPISNKAQNSDDPNRQRPNRRDPPVCVKVKRKDEREYADGGFGRRVRVVEENRKECDGAEEEEGGVL